MAESSRKRLRWAALRFAWGAGLFTAGWLLHYGWVVDVAGLWHLDLRRSFAFLCGMLFGPAGILGVVAASTVLALAGIGTLSWPLLATDGIVALAAWAAFRRVPGAGRSLPSLRSFWLLLATAALAGLPAAALIAWDRFPGSGWWGVWLWWSTIITAIVVVAAPLAMLLAPRLGRALAPVPGERPPSPASLKGWAPWDDPGAVGGGGGERPWWRRVGWLGPVGALAAIGLVVVFCGDRLEAGDRWIELLFVFPILWAAALYGLRGGLLLASLASLSYLVVLPLRLRDGQVDPFHVSAAALCAGLLTFSLFGALWGRARDREARLLEQLVAANRQLRGDLERVVRALRGAIEAKDAYTEGHVGRVSAYSLEVGRRLGVGEGELELLAVASALHDVGKIGIPESILGKAGPLAPEELEVMQRHPRIGSQILEEVEGLAEAAPIVLYHQERWDGRRDGRYPGYPAGLAGEEIPLGARVIAVVDAFDAMTSDRPYRRRLSLAEARDELSRERGGQFDPRVVDVFLALLHERPWGTETGPAR